jgi:ribosomal protein S18 acetylase RimI-like enzyme
MPEHVLRFWRAMDAHFGSVTPTPWGAIVSDGRFPAIWDANYARVDVASDTVALDDVATALTPALRTTGTETFHVVSFAPRTTGGVLAELTALGHRLAWDLVMELGAEPAEPRRHAVEVVEVPPSPELWRAVESSMASFGIDDPDTVRQLRRIEEDVLTPPSKRWFGVEEAGDLVALGALMLLEGVGYVDNVATEPRARGRGYASAITARIVREALAGGGEHVVLFADPDAAEVVRMYERLGFREVGRIASTKGPLPVGR